MPSNFNKIKESLENLQETTITNDRVNFKKKQISRNENNV